MDFGILVRFYAAFSVNYIYISILNVSCLMLHHNSSLLMLALHAWTSLSPAVFDGVLVSVGDQDKMKLYIIARH